MKYFLQKLKTLPLRLLIGLAVLLYAGTLAGCSQTDDVDKTAQPLVQNEAPPSKSDKETEVNVASKANEPAKAETPPEPVELVIWFTSSVPQSDDAFDDMYRDLIEANFPHVTLQFLPYNSDNTFDKLIATKQPIDLVVSSIGQTAGFVLASDLQYDISDLIKQHNYDLDQIEPSTIEIQRQLADGGLYGLPMSTDTMTMFYNRDLFDLFGVDYPHDGLTWAETYDLIRQMARTDDGIRYWGMGISSNHALQMDPLSPPYINENNDPGFTDETFRTALETLTEIFRISGNEVDDTNWSYGTHLSLFQKEKTMATLLGTSALGYAYFADKDELNWDVAAYPVYADQPHVGPQSYPVYFYISSISKHKSEAFEIAAYITTTEFQTHLAGQGVLPISSDPKVMDEYGKLLPYMADKNTAAFLPDTFASPSYKGRFHSIGITAAQGAFRQVVLNEADLNTALREAVETANQRIAEELQ